MKLKLVVVLAVLFFASQALADQVPTSTGFVTIPDGSEVTSITFIPYPHGVEWGNASLVDFSFAGGVGDTEGNSLLGYTGTISFDSPVSDVSLSWIATDVFEVWDNVGDSWFDTSTDNGSGEITLPGAGITQITWQAGDEVGGITALDPTPDSQSVPEPSSMLLSAMGIAALIGLARKSPRERSDTK